MQTEAHDEALIKWGLVYDNNLGDAMQVTVIATGIGHRLEAEKGRDVWHSPPPELPASEDLEIPAFIRKGSEMPRPRPRPLPTKDHPWGWCRGKNTWCTRPAVRGKRPGHPALPEEGGLGGFSLYGFLCCL